MRHKAAVHLAMWVCGSLMLAACSGATDTSGDGAGQDQPAQTGGNIVFQFPTAPLDLDPSTSQDNNVSMPLWNAWFEYLVRLDPATGKFQPMLAEDWQISEDEKIYTFNLRSDVTFSDGSPMTADDVVFALNRDMEPKISLLHSLLDRIDKISAVNEHTVEIQLKNPWPHLLADLASPTAAIYPEQPLKDAGDKQFFTQQPVGSGPFVLSEVVPNSSYTVRRNAEYWGPRPKLDQITFDVVTDDSARATAVRGGQADIAVAPPPNQLASLENDSTVQVLAFPSARVELIVLNTTKPPFDDPKVRRAFSLALDREAIIESGLFGYAEPASSFLVPPPEATFQNPELQLYPQDVEKSKSLLRQAGVTTPLNIELEVSTGAEQDAILNIAQGNLEDIGMEVEPVRKDAASVDNDIIGLNYTAATTFWGNISANPSVQPLFAIDPNFCCDAYFSGYNDPQLIKLTHKAVTATDEQQAQQLFNQVQIQMAKASYLVPLYYPELTYLASADITGFGADPFGMYDWRTVGLTQ